METDERLDEFRFEGVTALFWVTELLDEDDRWELGEYLFMVREETAPEERFGLMALDESPDLEGSLVRLVLPIFFLIVVSLLELVVVFRNGVALTRETTPEVFPAE